jgi:hypothetical protein
MNTQARSDTKKFNPAELQGSIERYAELLGVAAGLRGAFACWETTDGLGYAMQIAVTHMNTSPATRQAAMTAMRTHIAELIKIMKNWEVDDAGSEEGQ